MLPWILPVQHYGSVPAVSAIGTGVDRFLFKMLEEEDEDDAARLISALALVIDDDD